jgi:SpoVK/Ycf46/Vps4 family AAA+-type ATPase
MSESRIFDAEISLPDSHLQKKQTTLLGFDDRYKQVQDQLRLLLNINDIQTWNSKYHKGSLVLCDLITEQYPLIIFHGDVGTGKTATAECMANRIVADEKTEDSMLFKLSNRVRGTGKVGEMSVQISEAFEKVKTSAGKYRQSILIIDEGDSLAATRSQEHSHHEDKVGVNTLIQGVDDLRRAGGRIVVFLCTNRLSALDPAVRRRAAIVQEFTRPNAEEREALFEQDLVGMKISSSQIKKLVKITGEAKKDKKPAWTYSDIRTRLYPAALALAFPDGPIKFDHLIQVAETISPSPVMEDK